ncbi:MAG: N-6 DNA methylase [Candidatus Riflebacteria bacterium]|nr:N-6 DNA methylase [Candidatus Riflebacteria bacterium]
MQGKVPLIIAPHSIDHDQPDLLFAVEGGCARKKSPFQLAQEFLNASEESLWAMVFNGRRLRLLRDSATLTRPCFLEFDIESILSESRYSDFTAMWRILHVSRAGQPGKSPKDCVWERWRSEGQEQGTRVREGLRNGVTESLHILGSGFLRHPANSALREKLVSGSLSADIYFQQLLRLVYRFIFLFTLEERDLIHLADNSSEADLARRLYAEGYSFGRLRERLLRKSGFDFHDDLWQCALIVIRGLAVGEPRLALSPLGGLFTSDKCPDIDFMKLRNCDFLEALRYLRWAKTDRVFSWIDYRNMGPEELGSVYESLLELVPKVDIAKSEFGFSGSFETASASGNARKTTGSFYTPDSLVRELIATALDPVIEMRISEKPEDPVSALKSISVIDPACGSGHFLLAAARRLAEKLANLRSEEGAVKPEDYRHALREVTAGNIYGVDRNPMALELAKTALWLEGYEPGRALSFLDHHLICGDSLLGFTDVAKIRLGIPDEAFKALSGDDREICKKLVQLNRSGKKELDETLKNDVLHVVQESGWEDAGIKLRSIEDMSDSSPAEITQKEKAWAEYRQNMETNNLKRAADLVTGAFLLEKSDASLEICFPTNHSLMTELFGIAAREFHDQCVEAAQNACRSAKVLHWQLAFPQIFAKGGFDCVLGNPPWERIKLQEEEFFASRNSDIADAKNKAERAKRISWLYQGILTRNLNPSFQVGFEACEAEKRLYSEFISARRIAEAVSIFDHLKSDEGGRFPLTGVGDVNTYAFFAEMISQITSKRGRAGFIVPTGIATDDSTKAFFAAISQDGRLVSLYDFENRQGLFPAVDSRMKFCLITLGKAVEAQFAFFLTNTEALADERRSFSLSPAEFALINPNTRTCPVFRIRKDAELTKKIYANVPVLIREETEELKEVNPWGISFLRMFDMANDSHFFKSDETVSASEKSTNSQKLLPLYEAKMIHQFDHRWATYETSAGEDSARDVTEDEKRDPDFSVRPRYWIDQREVLARIAAAPRAFGQAYAADDEKGMAVALANWLIVCFPDILAEGFTRPVQEQLTELAGPHFALIFDPIEDSNQAVEMQKSPKPLKAVKSSKPKQKKAVTFQWLEQRIQTDAATRPPLNPEELEILRHSPNLQTAAAQILDRRSPRWLMGWRDICRATDERSVIASVIPRAAVGNNMPLMIFESSFQRIFGNELSNKKISKKNSVNESQVGLCNLLHSSERINNDPKFAALIGNLSSIILDFFARHKVGGIHLNYFIYKQLPILPPDRYTDLDLNYIVPRVLELTYTSHSMKPWAEDLGFNGPPFQFDPERRAILRAELDAWYARLYGLTRDELSYILSPADTMGPDYPSETFRVLKNNEERRFSEFRTRRLTLEAFDNLCTKSDVMDNSK